MSLKSRVSDLAKAHHQSVSELERTLNFSNGSIGKWDKQNPSVDRVQAVADFYGVSVDYLLGNTQDPRPNKKDVKLQVDVADDDVIMTFEGKPIPPEDVELMRRLLRGGQNK